MYIFPLFDKVKLSFLRNVLYSIWAWFLNSYLKRFFEFEAIRWKMLLRHTSLYNADWYNSRRVQCKFQMKREIILKHKTEWNRIKWNFHMDFKQTIRCEWFASMELFHNRMYVKMYSVFIVSQCCTCQINWRCINRNRNWNVKY